MASKLHSVSHAVTVDAVPGGTASEAYGGASDWTWGRFLTFAFAAVVAAPIIFTLGLSILNWIAVWLRSY